MKLKKGDRISITGPVWTGEILVCGLGACALCEVIKVNKNTLVCELLHNRNAIIHIDINKYEFKKMRCF